MRIELTEFLNAKLELVAPANSTFGESNLGVLNVSFNPKRGEVILDWNDGEETFTLGAYPKSLELTVDARATVIKTASVDIEVEFPCYDAYGQYKEDPENYILANHHDEIMNELDEDDVELELDNHYER
jgi:hypothetical protein|tara:strand:- start:3086 stop:3472 length:387 start_codon:yes stop_codon:yes gene_type:complete